MFPVGKNRDPQRARSSSCFVEFFGTHQTADDLSRTHFAPAHQRNALQEGGRIWPIWGHVGKVAERFRMTYLGFCNYEGSRGVRASIGRGHIQNVDAVFILAELCAPGRISRNEFVVIRSLRKTYWRKQWQNEK
jgi:hypothetical protein